MLNYVNTIVTVVDPTYLSSAPELGQVVARDLLQQGLQGKFHNVCFFNKLEAVSFPLPID